MSDAIQKKTYILIALLLVFMTVSSSVPCLGEEKIVKKRVTKNLYYIPADERYINDYKAFGTGRFSRYVKKLNTIFDGMEPHVPVYCYLAESSRTHQITPEFNENSKAYEYLVQKLHVDGIDHLKFSTYAQFCEYFYQTDHHWNYKASYQGYMDIVRMLLGDDEPLLTPDDTVVTDAVFQGSFAKQQKNPVSEEVFTFYRFDHLPVFSIYVNGKRRASFGNMKAYLNGKYSTDLYTDHYSQVYGGFPAQIVYETNREEKKNLLVICNSYAAPLRPLLASHYNKTVFITPSFYRDEFDRNFSVGAAVEEYDADQILLLGDVQLFIDLRDVVK